MNKNHHEACMLCVNACEATIGVIQEFVAKCSSTDVVECVPQAGRLRQYVHESIQACLGCITATKRLMEEDPMEGKQSKYTNCLEACMHCVTTSKRFITSCEESTEACLKNAGDAIKALEQCAAACKACLQ